MVGLGVGAVLLAAVAVRLLLLARSGWLLEGDDSLSSLMGLAILDGDHPIMLKNQTYAAAWEPYAMAASYSLFGVSRASAKLPALAGSLAFVVSTALLARAVGGRAAGWFAAVLAAVPPAYVLVMTLKPWAPYTEAMLSGSLALVCATRLAFPRAGQRDRSWAVGCGLAGGIAFFMHPLAVWYLLPAASVVLGRVRGARLVRVCAVGVTGFVVGALPLWIYNGRTGGATVRFVMAGTGGQTADRLAVLSAWWNADLPRGIGLWDPWGPSPYAAAVLTATLVATAVVWAVLARDWRQSWLRPLDTVLLLLAGIPALFVLSGFGGPALNPYGFDATGRYSPPIWNGVAVVLGSFLAAVWRRQRLLAASLCAVLLCVTLFQSQTVDPVAAFQSPYWPKLPVDNRPLLAALRADGVSRVWLNHWAGLPVMFDARAAGQELVAYDWYDVQAGGIDRFPEYRAVVEAAERPAFVLVTDEPRPELERRLDELAVVYAERRVAPYVVVIPLSRRVHPAEVTGALDYRY